MQQEPLGVALMVPCIFYVELLCFCKETIYIVKENVCSNPWLQAETLSTSVPRK